MKINNRRYLGNKYKLLPFIRETVQRVCGEIGTFFDVFAGTGAVSSAFLESTLFVNDLLYSNHLAHETWFSPQPFRQAVVRERVAAYNALKEVSEANYMSETFGDTYFSVEVCRKIGAIREDIEARSRAGELWERERAMLVTSLLYAIDKVASTCGHYDAYRKGAAHAEDFVMGVPEIDYAVRPGNRCFNRDANALVQEVRCDLAYLDPPYNSQQYCDAYHLLENVARWEKPAVRGVARKMERRGLKSEYCTSHAEAAFADLVAHLDCRFIVLSYNNTGLRANDRSNAKLSDDAIWEILGRRGKVRVFTTDYRAFSAGKSENHGNAERLFLCSVEEGPCR